MTAPRPTRWADSKAASKIARTQTARRIAAQTRAREDTATLNAAAAGDRAATQVPDSDNLGLTEQEWAEAGQLMAQEAIQAEDDAAETGDGDTGDAGTAEEPELAADTPPGSNDSMADAFSAMQHQLRGDVEEESIDDMAEERTGRDQRYRERARTAEAENEKLRATIERMHRAEIHRHAAGILTDPEDLYRDGASVADMIGEDGGVDVDRVKAVAGDVAKGHPHWAARRVPSLAGLRSGSTSLRFEKPTKSFADAFRAQQKSE